MDQLNNIEAMTPVAIISASFIAGFVGSIHCLGMCGGIAVSCSRSNNKNALYQIGRLTGYLIIAVLAAVVGESIKNRFDSAGNSHFFAYLMGAMLIWLGVSQLFNSRSIKISSLPFLKRTHETFGKLLSSNSQGGNTKTTFFIGLFTIFLPCGLLYSVVLALSVLADPVMSVIGISSFWFGTLPLMASTPAILKKLLYPLTRKLPTMSSLVLILIGLLTIASRFNHLYASSGGSCH